MNERGRHMTTTSGTAPGWKVWLALWTVYVVWGSTYLAIRIQVRTLPPLLSAGTRFFVAGMSLYCVLLIRGGRKGVGVTSLQLRNCAVVGICLFLGANGMVGLAEQEVPSSLAALILSSVPLWVILYRTVMGDRVGRGTLVGVAIGFAGVAILVRPENLPPGAPFERVLLLLFASASWAFGSFISTRRAMPENLLVSSGYQMITGGVGLFIAGLIRGEGASFEPSAWSGESLLALGYLVAFGSLVAFTAYAWLLQSAPISKVATYAYVNPIVGILLGSIILDEAVTGTTLLGAAVIVGSVAFIIRKEAMGPRVPELRAALNSSGSRSGAAK
jgi:drug/metabolite transporter (DMT)-like permease